jgi:hypothetical protein
MDEDKGCLKGLLSAVQQRVNVKGHLHEVKSAQTSAPKTALARPFIKYE